MRLEASLHDVPWREIPAYARTIEALGFDSIAQPELRRDPFLPLTLVSTATERARLVTSVAIAFPRSPMANAYTAWNLQEMSNGRFVLGLGTQVKGHIERRFSTVWGAPGPRLRDYILGLRAIWEAWQHQTPLAFKGEFYAMDLMTPEFSPPPLAVPPPGIQIAAVNAYNIQLAGELCDGLRIHPFSTPAYTRDVIWPNVAIGAKKSGRSLASFEMVGGGFIATGATEAEVQSAREQARYRIAFYASTRTYLPVLAHHGWEAMNGELRRLIAQQRWSDLATVVPDAVLDEFCVSGTYDTIVAGIRARYEGLVDCVGFPVPQDSDAPRDQYMQALDSLRELIPAVARDGKAQGV
ncbi:MAG: TIGR03617 family F420-dependent LLM class oxidoreductase [Thermomicrobia bacterium]|nr:TIGR03617 family F420-dependent LLM class oxidoreductase [Thermomicrobia bacterium]